MELTQISNSKQKLVASLSQKKYRDKSGLFLVEGSNCCDDLLKSKLESSFLLLAKNFGNKQFFIELAHQKEIPVYLTDNNTFRKISDVKKPQGVLCVAKIPKPKLDTEKSFLYLESISDPGNLGTIIRSADWFNVPNIILSDDSVDCYNPKTVRSTMGSLFRVQILYQDKPIDFIKSEFPYHETFAADINGKDSLKRIIPPDRFGLMFGSEASGFSSETLRNAKRTFRIEGEGEAESLNLAVSVAISLYHFSN